MVELVYLRVITCIYNVAVGELKVWYMFVEVCCTDKYIVCVFFTFNQTVGECPSLFHTFPCCN